MANPLVRAAARRAAAEARRRAAAATREAQRARELAIAREAQRAREIAARRSAAQAAVPAERGRTAYGTYELAPGMMTGHRQDILSDEAARERFSVDPATSWRTGEGTDLLYDVVGLPQSTTVRTTGIYTPDVPGAPMESNIGFAARPRLTVDEFGNPIPEDIATMSGAEAVRAVADTQGAGAWSMPTRPTNFEEAGAIFLPTGAQTDIERLLQLKELGAPYGLPEVVDVGEGVFLTSFDDLPTGSATRSALIAPARAGQPNLGLDINRTMGQRINPEQVGLTGRYIGLEKAWMEPEGSGAVSELLRRYIGDMPPERREMMLEDPRVAQAFGQRFLRDEEARMGGIPVRDDVQRAREAIAEQERLQELFELIRRGVPVMARGGLASAC